MPSRDLHLTKSEEKRMQLSKSVSVLTNNVGRVRSAASRTVLAPWFDGTVGMLLILNAIIMGLEVDYAARHIHEDTPVFFYIIQCVLCVVFVLEIGLRIFVYGRKYFTMHGWQVNIVDC